jgi:hypothetical protein
MGIVSGVLRGQVDVVEIFSDFVYLFSEDDSSESFIETVPDGVAATVDGMLAVPVATDASPLRLRIELYDQQPPPRTVADGEDVAVLAWRPRGRELRLGDTTSSGGDDQLTLGPGDDVLAVEVRCRGRDEANHAGIGEIKEPVEEILIRLWPDPAPAQAIITRQSRFARALAGEPPDASGPAPPLTLGQTVVVPVYYNGFYLHDDGVPSPWEWRDSMVLSAARVNGLVSNLPGLARVSTGTQTGEVELRVQGVTRPGATLADALGVVGGPALPGTADAVAVTHHTDGAILVADIENNADHYRFEVPAGDVGLLVVAWDRDQAARRRRTAKTRERIDLVFWTGETPGELIVQARSAIGQVIAEDDQRIRHQLDRG